MKTHLIGVAGTGMAGLASLLRARGHEVRGSDQDVYPPMSTALRDAGVTVLAPFSAANLDWGPERVVVGNACRRDHVEVAAATAAGLPLSSMPQVIAEEFLASAHPAVVAGTHGKTTTAALLAHLLTAGGRDPSWLVGGVPIAAGRSAHLGSGPFVIEGDEYDCAFFDKRPKFAHYRPRTLIVTSLEYDHADIYPSIEAIEEAFRALVASVPEDGLVILCVDGGRTARLAGASRAPVQTYGPEGEWRVRDVRVSRGRTRFELWRDQHRLGDLETGLGGEHNLYNAVAAVAAAAALGVPPEASAAALPAFAGVRRRQEVRGTAQGVTVIDDFGHHPTAIRETLRALRGRHGRGKLVAVFEPRTATSRRSVFQAEFADALAAADEAVIAAVHAADRLPASERLDPARIAADLRGRGTPAEHIAAVHAIADHVAGRVSPGDTVVFFSSGPFGGAPDLLLDRLGHAVIAARPEDAGAIARILDEGSLPHLDFRERLGDFLVLRDGGRVIGCVGLEAHGEVGLLRSLAVTPSRRGEGLGWVLAEAALARARAHGCRQVFLFTVTAANFFADKLGFTSIPIDHADPSLRASAEVSHHACRQATCMLLDLRPPAPRPEAAAPPA